MLRAAKLSLLLAPLFMVSLSGCATPRTTSQSTVPVDSQQTRLSRLMSVAEQYEKEGKPEAAMRLYDHILAQQPGNSQATERRNLLVEQGVKSDNRSLKPDAGTMKTPTAFASKSEPKAPAAASAKEAADSKQVTEIPRKSPNLSEILAERDRPATAPVVVAEESLVEVVETPQLDQPVAMTPEKPFPTPEAVAQQASADPAQKKLDAAELFGEERQNITLDSSKWKTASREKTVPAIPTEEAGSEQPSKSVVTTESDEGWIQVKPNSAGVELADRSTGKNQSIADSQKMETARTVSATAREFPKPVTESSESVPAISPANGDNQAGKLLILCENLPAELAPLVTKLESADPAVRLEGLNELGEQQKAAQPASVAVYALLSDTDPRVAVNAAGTLRQITGDAWSSVHTLTRYLDHENTEVVQLSAYLLGQIGPEAMDAVPTLETVRDTAPGLTGLYAAEALTRIAPDDRNSVAKLTGALADSSAELRWFAAVSLGTVAGDCEGVAVEALRKALQDQTPDVRVAACLSLGGLGDHAQVAIPDLKQAAQTGSPDVKSAAETALVCLGG